MTMDTMMPETNQKNTEGKKFDGGKARMDLLPPAALKGVAEVLGMGAAKYGDYNWYNGIVYSRLYAAALRHLIAWWEGEEFDPESGINHINHAMCNLAFLSQFVYEERRDLDDRKFPRVESEEVKYDK